MKYTVNLNLKKPDGNDFVTIEDLNYNADKIDIAIKELIDNTGDLSKLNTTQKNNLVAAINEVLTKLGSIKLEANNVTIADLENLFVSDKVEGALAEVMKKAKANETSILNLANSVNNLQSEVNGQRLRGINIVNAIYEKVGV